MLGTRWGQSTRAAATAAVTGAAVAVALAAGCGTVRAGSPGTMQRAAGQAAAHRAARTGPAAGPAAGSAGEAQRLADELLSDLVLPADAHRIPWHPPPLLGQTEMPLGVPHLADAHGLWSVPTPVTALAGFVRAHRPDGLAFEGFGRGMAAGQLSSETTTFFLRSVPAGIQSAQLTLEMAPAGRNLSLLRADGEVIWYPPRSAGEYLVPARFHAVTVAASYFNPKLHTVRRTFTSPSVIARLARFLNGLRAAPGGLTGCPMVSATYAVTFRYSAGGRPYLTASDGGCGTVGITVNGLPQPGLADPSALITRAVQAALAGHPASIAPEPTITAAPPSLRPTPVPVISPPGPPAGSS